MHLGHEEASLGVQQLALGSGVEQEGVAAEGEGPIQAKLMLRLVMRLPPCHIMILYIQLLTAQGGRVCVRDGVKLNMFKVGGCGKG